MKSKFQDIWGRYHDKECIGGLPSSNNGWIFTSYAKKLGLHINQYGLILCFSNCKRSETIIDRSPDKKEPPMSRDEILGLAYLGLLKDKNIPNWNFCPYDIPKFNLFKTVAAFWRLRKAHRNAVWENGGEPHAFRFAFSVPIQDRAFILTCLGKEVPKFYQLVNFIDSKIKSKNKSSRLIHWLKHDTIPDVKDFELYFGKSHIFTKRLYGE